MNFFEIYLMIADEWHFYDNSFEDPLLIARKFKGDEIQIVEDAIWINVLRESFRE